MGLNSDEEDEAPEDIEEDDDESIHDVLGSDENEDHDSEDLSEGHSVESVNKGKGPGATSEDIAEDDSDDVPLAQKRKDLRRNPTVDAPNDLLERFKQSTGTTGTSSAPKSTGMRVKRG
ncbi:hypothetical protein LIER_37727 [Lithospermum erythrorhizon]|uniref:Uncharacterized protein n=1 Tax=Lithospermum erythrorhizon TaxID=34254 RepID=A0AAV3PPS5_LITER